MAVSSRIAKENGNDTGKGNGFGYQKKALSDGHYTMDVSGLSDLNRTDHTTDQGVLADGTHLFTEVRGGGISIDTIGGEAALHLVTDSSNGRLRVDDVLDTAHQVKLGNLGDLSFDYFVQSSDRTDVIPVIRITLDADGNLATTNDRVDLVFEWAYQGNGAVTQGSWQHADLSGGDWRAWERANGQNLDFGNNFATLSTWESAAGFTPVGGIHVDANSLVIGWSIADGSGNGTNSMYLDHLHVGAQAINFA
ncbi:MAG TPA: hypothetical protein VKI45_00805 [Allosphingosinicella sp.]|nr:hypothetical protein [Allosphingosinicella sp.]